jgi:hypothetical protein
MLEDMLSCVPGAWLVFDDFTRNWSSVDEEVG